MSAIDYAARRERVLSLLGRDSALVLAAAPELQVGPDGHLRYIPDADFYYLTGCSDPEAVLVLCPRADSPVTAFVRPRDEERERWTGPRGGVEGAREQLGAQIAHAVGEVHEELPKLLQCVNTIYAPFDTQREEVDRAIRAALLQGQRNRARKGCGPDTLRNARVLLGELRLRKEPAEVELIGAAARITTDTFAEVAARIPRMNGEWSVHAALEHGFRSRGALGPAFPTIVAGDVRATVLHYDVNDQPLAPGSLVLIDAGARYRMYCADVSRTYPVSGRFTPAQRTVYELVLRAHAAAIHAIRPGASTQQIDDAALHVLVDGMFELGLLRGSRDEVVEKKEYKRYYPHRTSHWLGLDVHDAGGYMADEEQPTALEAGFVLTVEPGLYIPAEDEAAPPELRGIGVRLEDDILVTAAGHENLTATLALAPDDVEALMAGATP